jgi:DNA replication initiation complex subunit (GINS family)
MHGGHVPQALVKAKTSLALLRLPAIEALYLVVEQLERIVRQATDDLCPHCGYPNWGDNEQNIVIKACARLTQAANAVLDRTDMGPKATLEVKQSDFDIDLKQLIPAEEKEFDDIVANFEAFKARVNQRLHVAAFATLPDDPADDGSSLPPITVN